MNGKPIAAEALGRDGLGLLTRDLGQTKLAETLHAPRDALAAAAEEDGAARIAAPQSARAMRP